MTADDQHFLDIVASLPHTVRAYTLDLPYAGALESYFDSTAATLRRSLESATWLPDFARPRPPPPPPATFLSAHGASHSGLLRRTLTWIDHHRALVAAAAAFLGTGTALVYYRRRQYARKRRARRTPRGERTEVVVVAGSPHNPLARSLMLDLERRGFIVYALAASSSDEDAVRALARADILPLHLDVTNPHDVQNTLAHFARLLATPQRLAHGTDAYSLSFAGLVVAPDTAYPSGPVATVAPDLWHDALSARVLASIATVQAFLPSLVAHRARILLLTPAVASALHPAFHGVESTVAGALDGFAGSLAREMHSVGVAVSQLKLGAFDLQSLGAAGAVARDPSAQVLGWPAAAREAYAANFLAQRSGARLGNARRRGSPLRELHNAVFDGLERPWPWSVQRVGQGSSLYAVVGALAPAGLVGWMMGMRRMETTKPPERMEESGGWEKVGSESV